MPDQFYIEKAEMAIEMITIQVLNRNLHNERFPRAEGWKLTKERQRERVEAYLKDNCMINRDCEWTSKEIHPSLKWAAGIAEDMAVHFKDY